MSFTHYSPFTVATGQVPSTLTNFPMLLLPTANQFKTISNGGNVTDPNNYGTRPYESDGTTACTFELVPGTYNATTGFFEMWVLRGSLADGNVVRLYHGDASITTDGSSTSTWPSQFDTVNHYPNGSLLSLLDSSANGNSGTNSGATATTGQVDGGVNFVAASSQYFVSNAGSAFSGLSKFSIATSFKRAAINQLGGYITIPHLGGGAFAGIEVYSDTNVYIETNNNNAYGFFVSNDTSWHRLWLVFDGSLSGDSNRLKGFFDGAQQVLSFSGSGAIPSSAPTFVASSTYFGRTPGGSKADGKQDESYFVSDAPTPNWITADYNNQSAPNTFAPLGAEVAVGGTVYTTSVNSTTYSITGTAAALKIIRHTSVSVGFSTLTFQNIVPSNLRHNSVASGSFSITGSNADLRDSGRLSLTPDNGSYGITGANCVLSRISRLSCGVGFSVLNFQNVVFDALRNTPVGSGTFTLLGTSVDFRRVKRINADVGFDVLNFQNIVGSFIRSKSLNSGSLSLTGSAVNLTLHASLHYGFNRMRFTSIGRMVSKPLTTRDL